MQLTSEDGYMSDNTTTKSEAHAVNTNRCACLTISKGWVFVCLQKI